jgi:hypothetical protein
MDIKQISASNKKTVLVHIFASNFELTIKFQLKKKNK